MALLHLSHPQPRLLFPHLPRPLATNLNRRSRKLTLCSSFSSSSRPPLNSRRRLLRPCASSVNGAFVQDGSRPLRERLGGDEQDDELLPKFRKLLHRIQSVLPGGSWWDLSKEEVEIRLIAKPVTVWRALTRMWELVVQDRWVIFAAFSALILAALSEISIPHYLTASIFSAQSSSIAVFHRNVRLLVLFCIVAAICRLKSLVCVDAFLE